MAGCQPTPWPPWAGLHLLSRSAPSAGAGVQSASRHDCLLTALEQLCVVHVPVPVHCACACAVPGLVNMRGCSRQAQPLLKMPLLQACHANSRWQQVRSSCAGGRLGRRQQQRQQRQQQQQRRRGEAPAPAQVGRASTHADTCLFWPRILCCSASDTLS